jgi:hypothetical protein
MLLAVVSAILLAAIWIVLRCARAFQRLFDFSVEISAGDWDIPPACGSQSGHGGAEGDTEQQPAEVRHGVGAVAGSSGHKVLKNFEQDSETGQREADYRGRDP